MKKVIFSIFFFSLMVVGVQAQKSSCSKSSCTAKPAAATATCDHMSGSAASAETTAAAAKLASMDPSIETRTCPVSGTVTYVRKEEGAKKGEYTYVDLAYDATSNSFINVAPSKMEGAAGCSAKGTSANGKSCCAGSAGSGACCAGKSKSAQTPNKN